jgi:hypothetical protein
MSTAEYESRGERTRSPSVIELAEITFSDSDRRVSSDALLSAHASANASAIIELHAKRVVLTTACIAATRCTSDQVWPSVHVGAHIACGQSPRETRDRDRSRDRRRARERERYRGRAYLDVTRDEGVIRNGDDDARIASWA